MRKFFGYLILGITFFFNWIIQIALSLYGIFYIITTFLDKGIVAGLISIPIVAISLWIIHMIISFAIALPLLGLMSWLLEKEGNEGWENDNY